jgi:hypothetical protein
MDNGARLLAARTLTIIVVSAVCVKLSCYSKPKLLSDTLSSMSGHDNVDEVLVHGLDSTANGASVIGLPVAQVAERTMRLHVCNLMPRHGRDRL